MNCGGWVVPWRGGSYGADGVMGGAALRLGQEGRHVPRRARGSMKGSQGSGELERLQQERRGYLAVVLNLAGG